MVNAGTARNIVGIFGNVISFLLFLSPCPTFWTILKRKSVEEFKPDPYLATVMNCLFWILYGLPFVHPNSTLVLTINGLGLVMELVYLTIFYIYGDNKKRIKISVVLLVEAIMVGVVAVITFTVFHTDQRRSTFVGAFCIAFCILMYVAPLTVMYKVIKTKNMEYMPFWLSFTGFVNGSIWVAYGLIKFDLNMLIPNGSGAVLSILQLLLWIFYGVIYPRCCAGDVNKTDIEMTAAPPVQD